MQIIDKTIKLNSLIDMAQNMMGSLVKGVVDIEQEIMVIDAEMHADEEQMLLDNGSNQADLWGINIYPREGDYEIEFDSMINIRPRQKNFSRGVDDENIQKRILKICKKLIEI